MNPEIEVIQGGIAVDDRGQLSFVNDFNFEGVKRSYMVENFDHMFVRAWHGHKNEGKYVTVVSGTALIGAIDLRQVYNWDDIEEINGPIKFLDTEEEVRHKHRDFGDNHTVEDYLALHNAPQYKFVLSSRKPSVVWIPPGFVNGAMNLDDDTKIIYYSTKGLGESEGDDYRYDFDTFYTKEGAEFWFINFR